VTRRARTTLFAVAALVIGGGLVWAFTGLPRSGDYHGVYGLTMQRVGLAQRHATDLVSSLTFDYRGFDTLGEEFILFASVLGIVLILRELRSEHNEPQEQESEEHHFAGASEALRALALGLVPSILAVGVYIVVHGQITPGGGFQGGVILAAAPLAVFIAGRYLRMKAIAPHLVIELADALGAAGYALVGLSGLILVGVFFKNSLPLGIPGHLLSAGQIDIANVMVGLEVSGAFLIAWTQFFDQAMLIKGASQS
jgi:multicomponent Na+:H+ antiporter subunit B